MSIPSYEIPIHTQAAIKDTLADLIEKYTLPVVLDFMAEVCQNEAHFQGVLHCSPSQKIADHWQMAATKLELLSDSLR